MNTGSGDDSQDKFDAEAVISPEQPAAERVLGHTRILQLLGSGGMGEVWLGFDTTLERRVAVKTMRRELAVDEGAASRFYREARSVAKLNHPNIIQIFQIGEEDRTLFFTMEYVEGETLAQRIKRAGPIPLTDAIPLLRQIIDALDYACENAIIHRDIKPGNIMLDKSGRLKIADFGLAKMTGSAGNQMSTTGIPMGSPNYMSPEQAQGEPVDHRSDIYSLGITFYQMLTGHVPFHASTPLSVLLKHINEPLPEPMFLQALKQGKVLEIIKTMSAKLPADRFSSYKELRRALDAVFAGELAVAPLAPATVSAFEPTATVAPKIAPRRSTNWSLWVAVIAGLLFCLAAGAFIGQNMRLQAQRRRTEARLRPGVRHEPRTEVATIAPTPVPTPTPTPQPTVEPAEKQLLPVPAVGISTATLAGPLPAPRETPRRKAPVAAIVEGREIEQTVLDNYTFSEAVEKLDQAVSRDGIPIPKRTVLKARLDSMRQLAALKTAMIQAVTNGARPQMSDLRAGPATLVSCSETSLVFRNPKGEGFSVPWRELSPEQFLRIAEQALPRGTQTRSLQEFRQVYEVN